ncbi:MAG TPA: FG-GAP-like repeat-containing protein, partial [Terriglobales bacterium]|nr:FG-GAP-like repeat-containing protein [Terriglobales bacterium]
PVAIAAGDFNHDGKLDLVVGTWLPTSQLAVLLGNGDGTFQPAAYYGVSSQEESVDSVAVADFNHDGILDLAVNDAQDTSVKVFLGNGDGTFQTPIDVPLDPNCGPIEVMVGDFNGDGNPDLVSLAASGLCPDISVMLGNGEGTFQAPINTPAPYPAAHFAVGDFNRDGKLDLVTVGVFGTLAEAGILLGNGDGTFQPGATYNLPQTTASVAVGDLTGDHKLDIVTAGGGGVSVLIGHGDGTFDPPKTYVVDGAGFGIQMADFNGDGKPDIAVTSGYSKGNLSFGTVSVLFGNGDGTLQPATTYPVGRDPVDMVAGDFNRDRQLDLAVVAEDANVVTVLLNTGVVSFSPTTPLSFTDQLVGTISAPQSVTLTNTGSTALSISSVSVTGQFQLSSNTCGSSVAPGGNCVLSVTFQPQARGTQNGLLGINDSASLKPQVVELTGKGTFVSLSPTQLTFPAQKVGTKSTPQSVTLTNTGPTALTIFSVTITKLEEFTQTNNCVPQVAAGASCTIEVTFAPTSKGTHEATVSISDNGGSSPQTVPLTGTGTN